MILTAQAVAELRLLADGKANEVCGALVRTGDGELSVLQMQNVSETPDISFRFADEDTLQLYEMCDLPGWELLAVWHSHPRADAVPSTTDREYAQPSGPFMVIVGRDAVRVYKVDDDHNTIELEAHHGTV